MIKITRKGKDVNLSIEVFIPNWNDRIFTFEWDCGNEAYAGLLSAEMSKQLSDRIQSIREQEYERGYKDGRGKQKKKIWFHRTLKIYYE